jgi:hypothetical protein
MINYKIRTIFMKHISLALVLLSILCSCTSTTTTEELSFYYWKQNFQLSSSQQAFLADQGVNRLFVKFMDVDLEGGHAVPVAPIHFADESYTGFELVPCVFITNRTFQSKQVDPEKLAEKVWDYLQEINAEHQLTPKEYQFDCDWTPSTQEAYFSFLLAINKKKGQALLNSTLRLHQYKYPQQTGIPPVDKVTLMYYNMGDIEDVEEVNSILNHEKGSAYLDAQAYPVTLDVALPLFSWALVYRLGHLEAIISGNHLDSLAQKTAIRKTADNTFVVQQNHYFEGHYLNKGDQLRVESCSRADIRKAAEALSKIPNHSGTLLFYHLDETTPQKFEPSFFDELLSLYRH